MDLGKVAIIIRALQACNTLFGDVKPNNFEVTSFKVTDGTIEKFVTMDNATGFETSPIKYDGPAFQGIRLQMSIQGDKTIVGGQVTSAGSGPRPEECPVIGDDKELNAVIECDIRICPYLFGNAVYVIYNKRSTPSEIYKKPHVIEAKLEQRNIDCSERFGVNDEDGTFIFKKNGTCMEVNVDEFELPWEPHECDTAPIILTPDTPTQYYHLRYLTTLASCEMPSTITEEMVDNTFIRFTHIDSTETTTALPVSETSDVAVQSQLELAALVLGSLAVAVFLGLIIVGIVVCVKCREICMCCGKKTEKKKEKKKKLSQGKPPSVTAPLPHSAQENTKSLKKEEKDEEVFLEYMEDESDEDEDPKSFDVLFDMESLVAKQMEDDDFRVAIPKMFVGGFRSYFFIRKLGQGVRTAVYKYRVGRRGDDYVAVKIFDSVLDAFAEYRNSQGIHQVLRSVSSCPSLLAEVLDYGGNENICLVVPLCYRDMATFLDTTAIELQQKLIIAYHLLLPILQLQQAKCAHMNITPGSYMQRRPDENTCVLRHLCFAEMFGTEYEFNSFSNPDFMSATSHRREPASMVTDMQSWLLMVVFIFRDRSDKPPWHVRNEHNLNQREEGKIVFKMHFDRKMAFFKKLEPLTDENAIIYDLAQMIWYKNASETINMNEVLSYMEKLQKKFKFEYTAPWWDTTKRWEKIVIIPPEERTQPCGVENCGHQECVPRFENAYPKKTRKELSEERSRRRREREEAGKHAAAVAAHTAKTISEGSSRLVMKKGARRTPKKEDFDITLSRRQSDMWF